MREKHQLEVVADHKRLFKDYLAKKKEKNNICTDTKSKCRHGLLECYDERLDLYQEFYLAFASAINEASGTDEEKTNAGIEATRVKYAAVWNDVARMEELIFVLLGLGTHHILNGCNDDATEKALFAYYFYQHIAVYLEKTQPEIKWHRIEELSCDSHTLVSFYRKNIPCSCLNEIYEHVKSIPKTGICDYPNCPDREVEKKKMKCCTGCRKMTCYCSSACRKAHWPEHKHCCPQ